MSYSKLKLVIFASLLLYFVIGIAVHKNEIYPVFSWKLFDRIPNEKSGYTIRIYRFGNTTYNPPLYYSNALSILQPARGSSTQYFNIIQDFGNAVMRKNKSEISRQKEKLDAAFGDNQYKYELLFVRYDPVEFWKKRVYKKETVLLTSETN